MGLNESHRVHREECPRGTASPGLHAGSGSGGGHTRRSICTSGCHRQAEKGECLTMLCDTQSYGQRSRQAQPNAGKQSAPCERAAIRLGCSERVKTVVLEHSRSSGELIGPIHGIKYVKYR